MNCKKCGALLVDGDLFCKNCGASINENYAQSEVIEQPSVQTPEQNLTQNTGQTIIPSSVESVVQNSGIDNSNIAPTQPQNNNVNDQFTPQNNNVNGQFQPMNQQSWQNNNNQMPQPSQKNNNMKYIILGVVIVVVVFLILYFVFIAKNKNNNTPINNNGSGTQQTSSNSSYKVNFKGFTFSIPDNLVYEKTDETLMVSDEANTWVASFELLEASFSQFKAKKNQMKSLFEQNGYTSSEAIEKTLGGVDFITLELSTSGKNAIMALAKANSMYIVGITAFNVNNEFDYSLIELLSPVVSSLTYSSTASNMEPFNVSIKDLNILAN